jgi:hypothetical protein
VQVDVKETPIFTAILSSYAKLCFMLLVPVEGIEPPLLAEHDFESCASTSSATRALGVLYIFGGAPRQKEIVLGGLRPQKEIARAASTGDLFPP